MRVAAGRNGGPQRWTNGKSFRVGEITLTIDANKYHRARGAMTGWLFFQKIASHALHLVIGLLQRCGREMGESPDLAVIRHEFGGPRPFPQSLYVSLAHHYFENGIAHFTRHINQCIS